MACNLKPLDLGNDECFTVPSKVKTTWELELVGIITKIDVEPGKAVFYIGLNKFVVHGRFNHGLHVGDRVKVYVDCEGVLQIELLVRNF